MKNGTPNAVGYSWPLLKTKLVKGAAYAIGNPFNYRYQLRIKATPASVYFTFWDYAQCAESGQFQAAKHPRGMSSCSIWRGKESAPSPASESACRFGATNRCCFGSKARRRWRWTRLIARCAPNRRRCAAICKPTVSTLTRRWPGTPRRLLCSGCRSARRSGKNRTAAQELGPRRMVWPHGGAVLPRGRRGGALYHTVLARGAAISLMTENGSCAFSSRIAL